MNAAPAPESGPIQSPRKSRRRLIGFALGLVLLAGAAWVVYRQRADLASAWSSIRAAPAWLAALALLLPLANWLLISLSFWVLMRRHGRIGPGEMTAAIGGAWLLNYLPLRAGMIGRVAYHKAVNRIAVGDSVRVMIVGMGLGMLAVLTVLGIAAALGPGRSILAWTAALGAPPLLVGMATLITAAGAGPWWFPCTYLIRYFDVLVWLARYAVVFAIVGVPLSLPAAAAIAAACQVALVVPFVGNGLGLREWAVALTASLLPPMLLSSSGELTTATGLLADVVNRAAELAVAVPVGHVSLAYLGRRVGGAAASASG